MPHGGRAARESLSWASIMSTRLALLRDGNHHMPLLVSLLDIPVRIDDLVQRIAPVDDRPDLPVLDQICEEHQILGTPTASGSGVRVDVEVDAILLQSPLAPRGRQLVHRIEDDVIGPVSYTHLRAHETRHELVCRLLL